MTLIHDYPMRTNCWHAQDAKNATKLASVNKNKTARDEAATVPGGRKPATSTQVPSALGLLALYLCLSLSQIASTATTRPG